MGKTRAFLYGSISVLALLSIVDAECAAAPSPTEHTSCAVPDEAAKCGKYEQCYNNQREPALKASLTPSVANCATGLGEKNLWEENCMAQNQKPCRIHLTGPITSITATRLEHFFPIIEPTKAEHGIFVRLNSDGGDVDAAIRIGNVLRKARASVRVESGESCASACVLIVAGAAERSLAGSIKIHRPFRTDAVVLGADEAQRQYDLRNARIREYLQRMNISPALLDAMNRIPSVVSRKLTDNELEEYGLVPTDPVLEEERNAQEAQERGISMGELMDRKRHYYECSVNAINEDTGEKDLTKCRKLLE